MVNILNRPFYISEYFEHDLGLTKCPHCLHNGDFSWLNTVEKNDTSNDDILSITIYQIKCERCKKNFDVIHSHKYEY